jgi:exosortase J
MIAQQSPPAQQPPLLSLGPQHIAPEQQSVGLPSARAALLSAILTTAGVFSILSTAFALWALWTTDPLKSIGGFIPVLSFFFILRVWRSLGWEMRGTWWGLLILAATIALVHLRDHAVLELVLGSSWSIFLPPHSLVAFAYTAGAVLLFGGVRLFRAALFPIVLTWFVNPVPNFFTLHIDLPLQHISSHIARGFAHALGQPLSPDQLRLMFTPEFGMFIAPGCNGIRGAITMGFIALIAGYLYRFRWRTTAIIVTGAILLGYVFNLVRLCTLVLYYILALHVRWFQGHAEMGDYIIGAVLFFFATILLFSLIQRLNPRRDLVPPALPRTEVPQPLRGPALHSFILRWAAFGLLLLAGSVAYARQLIRHHERVLAGPVHVPQRFPKRVGNYTLQREWTESLPTGTLIFYWAAYAPDVPGTPDKPNPIVELGVSPVLGAHDTLICHSARGEEWLWHGDIAFPTASGDTTFSSSLFNDGAIQYLEATTVCTGTTCGQFTTGRKRFGIIYSRPDAHSILTQDPARPIPVLLRVETPDFAMAPDLARAQLTANLRDFLASADLSVFTQPYRQ